MPNFPSPRDFPFSVQDIRNEFDRLLDRVWHVGLKTAPLDGQDWAPSIDVCDEPERFWVRVEIPGVCANDVEVSIMDNTLTLKGTKPLPIPADEDCHKLRAECRYGGFCRTYEFPSRVRDEGVSATCRNGVLDITIPKVPETLGRKVKIQSED